MKLGVFIIPSEEICTKILTWKSLIRDEFGDQPYLLHPVHMTLFTIDAEDTLWEEASGKIEKFVNQQPAFDACLSTPHIFYDDVFTGGHTLTYTVEPIDPLLSLQTDLLSLFQGVRASIKDSECPGQPDWMQKNFTAYGYPYVGKGWMPHVTVASIKNCADDNKYLRKFLDSTLDIMFPVNAVTLWKISGDMHEKLVGWKLCRET